MSEFTIKKATRQGIKPLIALYSESGCGKSLSSLFLARGFAGPTGKIVLIDSESGRGSLYGDDLPGGYETLQLDPPFSPARYREAIETVEKSGAVIGICDSASHEWEGDGGVIDMAAANEEKSGSKGLHTWNRPKMEHGLFVRRLQRSSIPWIVCVRAKYKTRQVKDEKGKTQIVKDDYTSPIQADDFIFETTAHAEILHDHSIRLTKAPASMRDCFPANGPITIKHGELLAKWCSVPQGPGTAAAKPTDARAELLKKLRTITQKIHNWNLKPEGWPTAKQALAQYLWDEAILMDTQSLDELTEAELRTTIEKVERKLNPWSIPASTFGTARKTAGC